MRSMITRNGLMLMDEPRRYNDIYIHRHWDDPYEDEPKPKPPSLATFVRGLRKYRRKGTMKGAA